MAIMAGTFNGFDRSAFTSRGWQVKELKPQELTVRGDDLYGYPITPPDPEKMRAYLTRLLEGKSITLLAYHEGMAAIESWWSLWGRDWAVETYRG